MSDPGSIFISYRRSDSIAETGRIYDRLTSEFGRDHVYKDVDSIPLGSDFAEELDKAVGQCRVLLVIIGKTWVSVTEPDGTKRLDNPDDFVRIEVESALKRNIPVIPVLLEGASMPKQSQLPESLHKLARCNGTQVGYDPRFHADMSRLVKALKGLLETAPHQAVDKSPKIIALGKNVNIELVNIPGGRFLMGSLERKGYDSEQPQHEVTVPEFWMGKFPVTQAQYEAVIGKNPSQYPGADNPVEKVSWHDAVAFCEKASQETGTAFRLPSEAEWEYACRAGTTTHYSFGQSLTKEQANFNSNVRKTTPAGQYPPNNFGLYDMHGSVWEWCQDHWHTNYEGAPKDGIAWMTGDSHYHISRGGSWAVYPGKCGSAFRIFYPPGYRHNDLGFRVVCSAPRALR